MTILNLPAFYLGVQEEFEKQAKAKALASGFKPQKPIVQVPQMKASPAMPYAETRATLQDLSSFPISEDDFLKGGGRLMFQDPAGSKPAVPSINMKQGMFGDPAYDGAYYDKQTGRIEPYPNPGVMPHIKRNIGKYFGGMAAGLGAAGTAATGNPYFAFRGAVGLGLGVWRDQRRAEQALAEENQRIKHIKRIKKAAFDVNSMPNNENILPNISSQAKWKYVRTKDGLKLSDGNHVYSFGGLPEELPVEDTRLSRLKDDNILNFENDALSKGTAQIHRSSPDNIYLTLATGADNPTFMLQHEGEQNWRYSPSKKFIEKLKRIKNSMPADVSENVHVDPNAVLDAAQSPVTTKTADLRNMVRNPYVGRGILDSTGLKNMFGKAYNGIGGAIKGSIQGVANNPVSSAAGYYGLSQLVRKAKDIINPDRVIERSMKTPVERAREYINPAIAGTLGVLGARALTVK
jgi:hypothetical protein